MGEHSDKTLLGQMMSREFGSLYSCTMRHVVVFLLLAAVCVQAQFLTITEGGSGPQCPEHRCLLNRADCIGGQCVCRDPFIQGDGDFECYRKNNVFGEVRNDPTVRNFNNETARFDYPCRYLMTSLTNELKKGRNAIGTCECKVHFFPAKFRGKVFTRGFDFACEVKSGFGTVGFSIRKEGLAMNGSYEFEEWGVNAYLPDGPWNRTPVVIDRPEVKVECLYDEDNNQAVVDVPACGIKVGLRPYDIVLRKAQTQIPGAFVGVNCAHHTRWHDHDKVISTAPVSMGGTLYADLNGAHGLLQRGFTSGIVQNQPNVPPECSTVGRSFSLCDGTTSDLVEDLCDWILEQPRFMRCLHPGEDLSAVLQLYAKCIEFVCGARTCAQFVDDLRDTTCDDVDGIPTLDNYLRGAICSPP